MTIRNNTLLMAAVFSLATLVGCSSGGGGGSNAGGQAVLDLAGVWDITTQQTANSCDTVDPEPTQLVVEVMQNGANLTMTDLDSGDVVEGTINGQAVTLRMVQETVDGGDVVRVELDATLQATDDGNFLSGSSIARAFLLGTEICAIEDSWSGARRQPNPTPPGTADVDGLWDVTATRVTPDCGPFEPTATFVWELSQVGGDVEIIDTADGPFASAMISGSVLTFDRTVMDGDATVTYTGQLTVAADALSFSGSVMITSTSPSETCQHEYSVAATRQPTAPPVPSVDVEGDWTAVFTQLPGGCFDNPFPTTTLSLVQSGAQVTMTSDVFGHEGSGTLSGDTLTLQWSDSGFDFQYSLQVASDGLSMSGTYEVLSTDPGFPCDFAYSVDVTRN